MKPRPEQEVKASRYLAKSTNKHKYKKKKIPKFDLKAI